MEKGRKEIDIEIEKGRVGERKMEKGRWKGRGDSLRKK